jgi:hypothetical protein
MVIHRMWIIIYRFLWRSGAGPTSVNLYVVGEGNGDQSADQVPLRHPMARGGSGVQSDALSGTQLEVHAGAMIREQEYASRDPH